MWGRGFGRWFGRGWGFGRGFGRGFGFGARLGYCPWTGLPRGARWWWGYGYPYNAYPYGYNYGSTGYGSQYTFNPWQGAYGIYRATNPQTDLQSEAEFLKKRLDEITKRIEELEGK